MRRGVFVGGDETGHYRLETAEEVERRLTADVEKMQRERDDAVWWIVAACRENPNLMPPSWIAQLANEGKIPSRTD
jgi:F0F1-type ATP synthase membrane subunit b/b'